MTGIYDAAQAYEIGFSYRDIPAEVDAVVAFCTAAGRRAPLSVLEVAAGPADHALEFARRGATATALDLSMAMCERARVRATTQGLELAVVQKDMLGFELGLSFDLAICMIDSIAYIPDLPALLAHLLSIRRHLNPAGIYVIESAHPADIFGANAHTITEWTVERDGVAVRVQWGDSKVDTTDPIRQSTSTQIILSVTTADGTQQIREIVPQRWWTSTELEAVGRLAGLQVVATYGAFNPAIALDSSAAWRMLTVYALA